MIAPLLHSSFANINLMLSHNTSAINQPQKSKNVCTYITLFFFIYILYAVGVQNKIAMHVVVEVRRLIRKNLLGGCLVAKVGCLLSMYT